MNAYAFDAKEKTIQIIIPYGVGGGSDIIFLRMQQFAKAKGINLIPIYRPGANGAIGSKIAYESPPDGYTMGLTTIDAVGNYILLNKTTVDPNNVLSMHKNIHAIVSKDTLTLKDLFSMERPVKAGYTTLSHRAILEYLKSTGKFKSGVIFIPYKTPGDMIQNAVSGDIDIGMTSFSVLAPLVKSGRLQLLATDSRSILTEFPNSRRLMEREYNVPDFNKGSALILPAGTPENIRNFWKTFVDEYLDNPAVKEDIKNTYSEETKRSVAEMDEALRFTVLFLEKAPKE
jgi:tripartite-type tricarboxylate transporter receptor subunit TctC